jgi:hypothetical protein
MRTPTYWLILMLASGAHAAPAVRLFDTPDAALAAALAGKPRVIAFGEYHQIKGRSTVPSALTRFRTQLLPTVAPLAGDLVVETWVTAGKCGKTEEKVAAQVEKTTQRPEATEDEIVTLLKAGKAAGLRPHILTLDCKEYQALLPKADGQVDYVALLATVTRHLRSEALAALKAPPHDRAVVVYGGALHNDVYPRKELRAFSFAADLTRATKQHYLEVDLYVPEYVEDDAEITGAPWWVTVEKRAPGQTALVERGPASFIVVFPRTPVAAASSPGPSGESHRPADSAPSTPAAPTR